MYGLITRVNKIQKERLNFRIEKEKSEALLFNILPEEVATELKEKGESQAKMIDEVTVLFSDFVGFTEKSSKLSPDELVDELNACFKAFDQIMESHNIEKIKTIGDAYMAAGGLYSADTILSSKQVVLAALKMQEFMTTRKAANEKAGKAFFEMRLGIHTGPIVAGVVGVKKFQYDIWGDTVNTASRIETNGHVGKVNASEATYELLKVDPDLSFESRGKIKAKGKGEIEMYFVSKV
jgi:class 3 adenylate cyclase